MLSPTKADRVLVKTCSQVLEKLRSQALLQSVTIMGDHGRYGHVTSNTQMDFIQDLVSIPTITCTAKIEGFVLLISLLSRASIPDEEWDHYGVCPLPLPRIPRSRLIDALPVEVSGIDSEAEREILGVKRIGGSYSTRQAAAETVEHAAVRMSLYLGRLKVLKSGLGRKAGGKYLAMGRCGLVSCWAEVEKRFGFTALEAYAESIRAYR